MARDVNTALTNLSAYLNSEELRAVPDARLVAAASGIRVTVGDLRAVLTAMAEAFELLDAELRAQRTDADRSADGSDTERWVESMRRPVGLLPVPVPE